MWNDAKHVGEVETLASADVETREVREMRNGGSNHVPCQPRATLWALFSSFSTDTTERSRRMSNSSMLDPRYLQPTLEGH